MKLILFFLLFQTCFFNGNAIDVVIKIKDCREFETHFNSFNIKLLRNNKIIDSIRTYTEGTLSFSNLLPGDYSIEYFSIISTKEIINLELKDQNVELVICVDEIDYTKFIGDSFINQLRVGENYELVLASYGCEHGYMNKLCITRDNFGYYMEMDNYHFYLDDNLLNAISNFEIELRMMATDNGHHSTSTDYYYLYYNDNIIEIVDSDEDWNGATWLFLQLFGCYQFIHNIEESENY